MPKIIEFRTKSTTIKQYRAVVDDEATESDIDSKSLRHRAINKYGFNVIDSIQLSEEYEAHSYKEVEPFNA